MSDGYNWHCQGGYFGAVPAAPVWGYSNDFDGDYNQISNDYPGPAPVYNNR
jgi:hypothetical protein